MIRLIGSCGALALCAGAMAAPFAALGYEAGGALPGVVGAGFTVSGGGFFNSSGPAVNAISPANNFTAINFSEFDSHFALDTFGPSARNRSVGVANNSVTTTTFYGDYGAAGTTAANYDEGEMIAGYTFIQAPGSHIGDPGDSGSPATPNNQARTGVGVAPPPVVSGFAPNVGGGRSGLDGIFVARFTVQSGATLSGGFLFNQAGGLGGPVSAMLVLNGPAVSMGTSNGAQLIVLRSYRVGSASITAASTTGPAEDANGDAIPFGGSDVFDLWVQVVPTPGAAALLGLGGLVSLRRRRA